MKNKTVFLCGFMGSGKSTVGSLLARLLDCEYDDLDEAIVSAHGHSIAEIFATGGEAGFRQIEAETLHKLKVTGRRVIALGGGTMINDESRQYILKHGLLIYLSASPETIAKRLDRSANLRPLLQGLDLEQRKTKIQELMSQRAKIYELAPIHIVTDGRLPLDLATDISRMITHGQARSAQRGDKE